MAAAAWSQPSGRAAAPFPAAAGAHASPEVTDAARRVVGGTGGARRVGEVLVRGQPDRVAGLDASVTATLVPADEAHPEAYLQGATTDELRFAAGLTARAEPPTGVADSLAGWLLPRAAADLCAAANRA